MDFRHRLRTSPKVTILLTSSVLFLFALSPLVSSGLSTASSSDWVGPDANYPLNWNYISQNQITTQNVANLGINWVYPIPQGPPAYAGSNGNDVVVTPVVVSGISYVVTEYHVLIAQNVKTGAVVWQKSLALQNFTGFDTIWDYTNPPADNITGHYHGLWYSSEVRGTPLIWIESNNNTVYAFKASTGDLELKIPTINPSQAVPGNFGIYGTQSRSLLVDDARGLLIVGSGASEAAQTGRGFFQAYDIKTTPPTLLWRTFVMPPQDGSEPGWSVSSVQNLTNAWVFNPTDNSAIDLKALSTQALGGMLQGDWGDFGFDGTHSYAGTGTGWGGSWAYDQSTGIAYVTTDQASADFNASTRPGLNLWSDSVLAINEMTGKTIWAFQTTSHDLWDFDCSWSVLLANVTVGGHSQEAVFKGCKNGYFYALDAQTGKLLWSFNPPSIKRTEYTKLLNPLDTTQMALPWPNYPSTSAFIQNPCASGAFESNPAYDPVTNLVYVAAYNCPGMIKTAPIKGPGLPYGLGGATFPSGSVPPTNTTIWAIDANTGQAKWSYFIDNIGYRGGLSASGGVVFVPRQDGYLTFLNAQSGNLISSKLIGASLITQPAIAEDIDGNVTIVMPASGSAATGYTVLGAGIPSASPGYMFALTIQGGRTSTTTTSVSGSVDVYSSPLFLGVTGLAIVFIVATGVLALKLGKKPGKGAAATT